VKDVKDVNDVREVRDVRDVEDVATSKRFYCYILKNKVQSQINKTYNGFTVDLMRRIRQHNSEIKGGARYTTSNGNKTWHYYAVLTGFDTNVSALSCEWWIKHPTGNRRRPIAYSGPRGRILGLQKVLEDVRFKGYNKTLEYTLWIDRNYLSLLNPRTIKPNIRIMTFIEMENITDFYSKEQIVA
ncbi:MAG: GIY-YIG nuclease family protein, partial [Candidatus Paceibacterota bacterium]